jgi:hypothetical protein
VRPIVYSDFRYYHIEPSDLDGIEPEPMELLGGGMWRMCGIGINEPFVQMVFEDFFPGHEYRWTVWLDQIDLVTEGRAEISVLLPPELERTKTFIAEAPCIYLIPRGTRITWKPLGDRPFRHISIDAPNPGFPIEDGASVLRARAEGREV